MPTTFRWLHLTDSHVGSQEDPNFWQGVKDRLFTDLRSLRKKCGPWDLILFTGDLAYSGRKAEYDTVQSRLQEIHDEIKTPECDPQLLAVPGNHDLEQVIDKAEAAEYALGAWYTNAHIYGGFWGSTAFCTTRFAEQRPPLKRSWQILFAGRNSENSLSIANSSLRGISKRPARQPRISSAHA